VETLLPASKMGRQNFGMPSIVGLLGGRLVVGSEAAKLQAPLKNIKMLLDKTLDSVMLFDHEDYIQTGKTATFTKQELVGVILKELVNQARHTLYNEKQYRGEIAGVVVAVPANFSYDKLDFIREVVENTRLGPGLRLAGFVREPVAAALAYFHGLQQKNIDSAGKTILVYDFGGGTCDFAIVSSLTTGYKVVDYGAVAIGGGDFDLSLTKLIQKELKLADADKTGSVSSIIHAQSEALKMDLTSNPNNDKIRFTLGMVNEEGRTPFCEISRDQFEKATAHLMEKPIQEMEKMISKHRETHIDSIVCVGGSSNMLMVKRMINKRFK
jgi:molecular chaperone DnaK